MKYKNKPRGLNNKKCVDLRTERIGMLRPIEIDDSYKTRVYWKCQCDCGNVKSVAAKHLVDKLITSCGCNQYKTGKENPTWKGYEDISGKYWETLRRNAEKRKLEFSITPEYAWEIFIQQKKCCALTGLPLQFKTKNENANGMASVDRIDSSKGYVKGNVWWVDKKVNTIKWDLPLDIFLKTCKLVAEYNKL